MKADLKSVIDEVTAMAEAGDPVSMGTRFQQVLNDRGWRYRFTEDELAEALEKLGLEEEEIDSWFEEMASWL